MRSTRGVVPVSDQHKGRVPQSTRIVLWGTLIVAATWLLASFFYMELGQTEVTSAVLACVVMSISLTTVVKMHSRYYGSKRQNGVQNAQ